MAQPSDAVATSAPGLASCRDRSRPANHPRPSKRGAIFACFSYRLLELCFCAWPTGPSTARPLAGGGYQADASQRRRNRTRQKAHPHCLECAVSRSRLRSRRRIRDLVTQMAASGLSANQIGCARISITGPEPRLHQQAGNISARPTSHRRKPLATHGWSVHLGHMRSRGLVALFASVSTGLFRTSHIVGDSGRAAAGERDAEIAYPDRDVEQIGLKPIQGTQSFPISYPAGEFHHPHQHSWAPEVQTTGDITPLQQIVYAESLTTSGGRNA